jgi:tetratricopeptide (TPR) repeat protein
MGTSLLDLDDAPAALEAFNRGLDLATAAADVGLEQRALGGIGMAYARAGRRSESLEHLMRALDLARASRDKRNEARWLATLGQVLWRFDQPQEAMRALSDGMAAAQRVEDLGLQANMLTQLGRIYAAGGQTARAKEAYTHAYSLNRRLGQTEEQIDLLNLLSALAAETGQLPAALAFGEQALQLALAGNDRLTEARLRIRQGRLAMSRGDTTAALDHFTKGVTLAEAMAQPVLQARALSALAGAQAALGDAAAASTYRRALNQARAAQDAPTEAQAALGLGQLLLRQGARVEGSQTLHEAVAAARSMGARGQQLARRAEDLLSGVGSMEPLVSRRERRSEAATERQPTIEIETRTAEPDPAPGEPSQEGSGDAVYRETTLPPL